ncbi:hypothetical protein K3495_g16636, partial [Podosphaera aphanis]
VLNLPLQSDVIVWREAKGWKGPYKLVGLDIDHQECVIEMPYGPTTFRATAVKPYFSEEEEKEKETEKPETISDLDSDSQDTDDYSPSQNDKTIGKTTVPVNQLKRGRGRPKGSKNKSRFIQETFTNDILFDSLTEIDLKVPNISFINENFLTAKEISDLKLSLQLREQGAISTPGKPFEEADRAEFNSLIKNGVVKIIKYNPIEHDQVRLFNTRLIREVKGKGTANPYEKTRMVVAAWGDSEKKEILTQSPTIQRAS